MGRVQCSDVTDEWPRKYPNTVELKGRTHLRACLDPVLIAKLLPHALPPVPPGERCHQVQVGPPWALSPDLPGDLGVLRAERERAADRDDCPARSSERCQKLLRGGALVRREHAAGPPHHACHVWEVVLLRGAHSVARHKLSLSKRRTLGGFPNQA